MANIKLVQLQNKAKKELASKKCISEKVWYDIYNELRNFSRNYEIELYLPNSEDYAYRITPCGIEVNYFIAGDLAGSQMLYFTKEDECDDEDFQYNLEELEEVVVRIVSNIENFEIY